MGRPIDAGRDHRVRSRGTQVEVTSESKLIAVLDTGAISALSPATERGRARLRALRDRVDDLTVPAAVLAEGVQSGHPGRDYHVRRLLETVDVAVVDESLGYAAGGLRSLARRDGADPPPSGVDAIVVAHANERAGHDDVVIVTSDVGDIIALALHAANVERLQVQSI